MNHWLTGFCDWNIVLDSIGGPNHVNNFAAAPVMVDYANDIIYYTPYYYVLKQFSRSMRPGDVVLGVTNPSDGRIQLCAVAKQDGSYAINILNTGEALEFPLQIGEYVANVDMPANSVKTIIVKL
jgi:glucosylceramidase